MLIHLTLSKTILHNAELGVTFEETVIQILGHKVDIGLEIAFAMPRIETVINHFCSRRMEREKLKQVLLDSLDNINLVFERRYGMKNLFKVDEENLNTKLPEPDKPILENDRIWKFSGSDMIERIDQCRRHDTDCTIQPILRASHIALSNADDITVAPLPCTPAKDATKGQCSKLSSNAICCLLGGGSKCPDGAKITPSIHWVSEWVTDHPRSFYKWKKGSGEIDKHASTFAYCFAVVEIYDSNSGQTKEFESNILEDDGRRWKTVYEVDEDYMPTARDLQIAQQISEMMELAAPSISRPKRNKISKRPVDTVKTGPKVDIAKPMSFDKSIDTVPKSKSRALSVIEKIADFSNKFTNKIDRSYKHRKKPRFRHRRENPMSYMDLVNQEDRGYYNVVKSRGIKMYNRFLNVPGCPLTVNDIIKEVGEQFFSKAWLDLSFGALPIYQQVDGVLQKAAKVAFTKKCPEVLPPSDVGDMMPEILARLDFATMPETWRSEIVESIRTRRASNVTMVTSTSNNTVLAPVEDVTSNNTVAADNSFNIEELASVLSSNTRILHYYLLRHYSIEQPNSVIKELELYDESAIKAGIPLEVRYDVDVQGCESTLTNEWNERTLTIAFVKALDQLEMETTRVLNTLEQNGLPKILEPYLRVLCAKLFPKSVICEDPNRIRRFYSAKFNGAYLDDAVLRLKVQLSISTPQDEGAFHAFNIINHPIYVENSESVNDTFHSGLKNEVALISPLPDLLILDTNSSEIVATSSKECDFEMETYFCSLYTLYQESLINNYCVKATFLQLDHVIRETCEVITTTVDKHCLARWYKGVGFIISSDDEVTVESMVQSNEQPSQCEAQKACLITSGRVQFQCEKEEDENQLLGNEDVFVNSLRTKLTMVELLDYNSINEQVKRVFQLSEDEYDDMIFIIALIVIPIVFMYKSLIKIVGILRFKRRGQGCPNPCKRWRHQREAPYSRLEKSQKADTDGIRELLLSLKEPKATFQL